MAGALRFEDLQVGDRWESPRRTVTESDIVNFACLTGDFDPLHVDHEFARQSPFGKPLAHGLLGLSWVAGLASHYPRVETAAFVGIKSWEFLKPIFIGDTLQVVNEVVELRPNGRRRGCVIWKRTLVNQSGAIVQQGTFETLVTSNLARVAAPTPTDAAPVVEPQPTPPTQPTPPPQVLAAEHLPAEPAPPTPEQAPVAPPAAKARAGKVAKTKSRTAKSATSKARATKKTRRAKR